VAYAAFASQKYFLKLFFSDFTHEVSRLYYENQQKMLQK